MRATTRLVLVSAVIALPLATACALAWQDGSGLVQRYGGRTHPGPERAFLALLVLAFAAYVVAMVLASRGGLRVRAAIVVAVVIQAIPLGSPLLLSTDAWTYWGYGWIAAKGHGNPYRDPPSSRPGSPALPHLGADWRGTTTVYGPAFTAASEVVAAGAGGSSDRAAWAFKLLAAIAAVAAAALASRLSSRPGLATVAVGWSPLLAVHAAGGGHNDTWVGALVLAALVAGGGGREGREGALWALAIAVKWIPLILLPLRLMAERSRALVAAAAVSVGALALLATLRYGSGWVEAVTPLARNAATRTSYAIPSRIEQLGVPSAVAVGLAIAAFCVGYLLLVRRALGGRPRYGLTACLALVTTPYLAVWYLGWAVPLAAIDDEDIVPLAAATVLGAYLLPQAIPF